MVSRQLALSLTAWLIAAMTFGCATTKVVRRVSICELVNRPKKYANSLVKIRARVVGDGFEHTVLIDDACPKEGVIPFVPNDWNSAAGFELDRILREDPRGTLNKRVFGTFTGVYLWQSSDIGPRVLSIHEISEVTVTPSK